MAALKGDPQLQKIRFYLVPQFIKEPIFWRNYFYRVSIIKEAHGLLNNKTINSNTNSNTTEDTTITNTHASSNITTNSSNHNNDFTLSPDSSGSNTGTHFRNEIGSLSNVTVQHQHKEQEEQKPGTSKEDEEPILVHSNMEFISDEFAPVPELGSGWEDEVNAVLADFHPDPLLEEISNQLNEE